MRRLTLLTLCLLPLLAHAQETPKSVRMSSPKAFMNWCVPDLAKALGSSEEALMDDDEAFAQTLLFCQCELEKMPAQGQMVSQARLNSATEACKNELDEGSWDEFGEKYLNGVKQSFGVEE